jgi:predicted AAA+ superfamily ATPase
VYSRNKYSERLELYAFKPLIKVLTGMRRVGKSTLLKLNAEGLRKKFPSAEILEIDKESMDWDHIQTGKELYEFTVAKFQDKKGPLVVMVDEVQDIEDWERGVASLFNKGNVDIYLTGSNAKVFSSELSTRLSGRHIEIPVHPLVYSEFLQFSGLPDGEDAWGRFLRQGGMPGIHSISKDDEAIFAYLGAVADTVVLKDVIQRHSIRNPRLLQRLLQFVLDTSGSPLSAKRIADYLKSQNTRCSVDTILEYLAFFVDARVVDRVCRHDLRGKRVLEVHEKYYAADHGLRNAILGHRVQDIGIQLETIVCNHLLATGHKVEVGRWDAYEVDFVATKGGVRTDIQVAYLLADEKTLERELRPLRAIGDNYPRLVLSMDSHFREDHEGIRWMNVRKFTQEFGI